MASLSTAAVTGAGSSGIAAAKALHERGVPFTCFEAFDGEEVEFDDGSRAHADVVVY